MTKVSKVIDGTPAQLAFVAGCLAGALDRVLGTRTAWTIAVYMDMERGKLDWKYIERLERRVKKLWPEEARTNPPTVQGILKPIKATIL
jgi:hypothetical protein